MTKKDHNVFYHGDGYGFGKGQDHAHDHSHDHDHAHDEKKHTPLPISQSEFVAKAIESLLVERGLVTHDSIERAVEYFKNDIGPMYGAKMIARAWVDPEYKERLLTDGTKAMWEFGVSGVQTEMLIVKENKPGVHNVIVCTLCSCYPFAVLGLPPSWYKSFEYRSRVVIEPREVLKEFGLELDDSVEIHVWDANSEVRYMVLPERPEGTKHLSEEELAALVTRDSMVGVAVVNHANSAK
jgi:nitrile hydratase